MSNNRNLSIPFSLSCKCTIVNTDGSSSTSTYPMEFGSLSKIVTYGENHKDWRELISRCLDSTTSLSGSRKLLLYRPGTDTVYFKPQYWVYQGVKAVAYGCLVNFSWPALLPYGTTETVARNKFLKKARKVQTKFQSGTFLGELKETLHMLRNPALALRKGISDYVAETRRRHHRWAKKHTKASPHSLTKSLTDTWLEYVFGWSPLISDISDAADVLNTMLNGSDNLYDCQPVKAGSFVESNLNTQIPRNVPCGGGSYGIDYILHTNQRAGVIYRGGVVTEPLGPREFDPSLLGLSSWRDFVPTAWELIPYSFLVDYFLNVGEVIDGWADQRTRFGWVNRTYRRQSYSRIQSMKTWINPDFAYLISKATVSPQTLLKSQSEVLRVSVDPSTLFSTLYFRIPGLGTKWLNIAALGAQRVL